MTDEMLTKLMDIIKKTNAVLAIHEERLRILEKGENNG